MRISITLITSKGHGFAHMRVVLLNMFFAVHRYFAVTTMQQKLLPFAALVVVHNCV